MPLRDTLGSNPRDCYWERKTVNVEIYTEAIDCASEEELKEYACRKLARPFTDMEIIAGRRSAKR